MNFSMKKTLLFVFFGFIPLGQILNAATQPKAVIFVFADALESDRLSMTSHLGWFNSIWNITSALKAQQTLFEALFNKFGHQNGPVKAYDPQTHEELPIPFAEWLLGKDSTQVNREIKIALNRYKFPNGDKDKKFIFDVLDIIFNPSKMASTFGVKGDTLKLIERISSGPVHPRLILVANCNNQLFDNLRNTNSGSKVFRHFNDMYVSGNNQLLVEDPKLYQKIIQEHTYQASEYVLISSNKHAIHAAKSVGMQTVYSADNLYSVGKDYCKSTHLIKK